MQQKQEIAEQRQVVLTHMIGTYGRVQLVEWGAVQPNLPYNVKSTRCWRLNPTSEVPVVALHSTLGNGLVQN